MCYVSCITVSWNLHYITNNKTDLYNTINKTHEHQDKENDTKTSTHKTNKLETTTIHMNIKTKSTIPRQTHTKQKNSHLVSQDFTHQMTSKSQQKV